MMFYRFDPAVHQEVNCPVADWVRKRYRNPNLFVCHNHYKDSWTVSEWIKKGEKVEDLVIVVGGPGGFNRGHVVRLDWLLTGPAMDPCKMIREAENARRREQAEAEAEEADARRWCARESGVPDPLHM